MAIATLQEKFVSGLFDIYDGELRFLEAEQQMVQKASNKQLKLMLQVHIEQTKQQIKNLDKVFAAMALMPKRGYCQAAAALVNDALKSIQETVGNPELVDAAMTGALAKVAHYEVACYRSLIIDVEQIDKNGVMQILMQNLQFEEQAALRVEQSLPMLLKQAAISTNPKALAV